jgi:hypothetical protein
MLEREACRDRHEKLQYITQNLREINSKEQHAHTVITIGRRVLYVTGTKKERLREEPN